jgi:hypothetical protein
MSDLKTSCGVAPHSETQPRNYNTNSATGNATNNATTDLFALSMQVIERNQRNQSCNVSATKQLHTHATVKTRMVEAFYRDSCAVAFCKGGNHATEELRRLIKQVSENYGGDDPAFLEEYINDVICTWGHDLNIAIKCFRDASTHHPEV